jgi:hypothetical protein
MLLDNPSKVRLRGQLVADGPIGHRSLDLLNERSRSWVVGGTDGQLSKIGPFTGTPLWLVREIHTRHLKARSPLT